MSTIKDVAKRAGVSISTASYALNNNPKVSSTTKAKILKIAKELNYFPNGNARSLKKRKTNNIGVFIYEFAGPVFSDVLDGIHKTLQNEGFNIIVSSGVSSLNLLQERQVDAAIVFDNRLSNESLIHFGARGYPVYVLDRKLEGENIYSSIIENAVLVKDFIKRVIDQGYNKLAYLSGPKDAFNNQQRYVGFKEALIEKGIINHTYYEGDFTIQGGYKIGEQISQLKEKPDFIFCANDESAIGIIQSLKANNIKIPEDISIAGFDNISLGIYIHPSLTTIGIDHVNWGKQVAKHVIAILKKENFNIIAHPEGKVIRRESC